MSVSLCWTSGWSTMVRCSGIGSSGVAHGAPERSQEAPAVAAGRRGREWAAMVSPTSAKPMRPALRAATPGPVARTGTRSRVWSVPRQVGSLPWSAVRIRRSPGRRRASSSGSAGVEGLERAGVARDVAGVAPERVEVDVVGEDEVAVAGRVDGGERGVEERHVVLALGERRDAAVGEDVADLADGVGAAAGRDHPVEDGRLGRRDGEVLAVGGAREGLGASRRRRGGR